jgi:hypothetical protein
MHKVIFFPSPLLQELYQERRDIYFFDACGWSAFDGHDRKIIPQRISPEVNFKNYLAEPSEIIKNLRMHGPIWSRWVAQGDQFELLMRDALLDIYSLFGYLQEYKIRVAIFNTGVTHHIDTLICEQACILSGVSQIFLYTNNIMLGRLLPLIQTKGISDRRILGADLLSDLANNYIDRYKSNKMQKKPPESGGSMPSRFRYGYYGALIIIAINYLKIFTKKILLKDRQIHPRNFPDFKKYDEYFTGIDFFRQIRQQRAANKFYFRNLSKQKMVSEKSGIKILFAAHYQPEATSFPEGGELHNSVDILVELRRRGYLGHVFYKEHPANLYYAFPIIGFTRIGMCRSERYYSQLLALGCVFIDHSFQLSVEGSENFWYLPLTISGSIAVERALMGFHTIVTGQPWFKEMPGILNLSEIESLQVLDSKWVMHDPMLAKKAYEYLVQVLSGTTISNVTGIGSGETSVDETDRSKFKREFDEMITALGVSHKL